MRHDDDWVTHLWDFNHVYAHMETGGWHKCGAATRSGGSDGVTAYTLVETAEDHDERIRSERAVPERIEVDEWPDDDEHLRAYFWTEDRHYGDTWRWYEKDKFSTAGWRWRPNGVSYCKPFMGPWIRGERVEDGS